MARAKSDPSKNATANLGFEAKLWLAADKLRNNMDAAEYKHVVLGLIFLKYISDTFRRDLHPDLRADYVLANGSMSSNQSGEGDIRRAIVEADLVDCMVALPGQLFYSTQIPVCLWFLSKSKAARTLPKRKGEEWPDKLRARRGETLFIDARKMGTLIDRVHRELTKTDIEKIVRTYHSWQFDIPMGEVRWGKTVALVDPDPAWIYHDTPGFCKSATTAEIAAHGYVLTPGRYVGAEEVADDGDPFEEKMPRLFAELNAQFRSRRRTVPFIGCWAMARRWTRRLE